MAIIHPILQIMRKSWRLWIKKITKITCSPFQLGLRSSSCISCCHWMASSQRRKNDRLVFDASFMLHMNTRPFNQFINLTDEPDMIFGGAWITFLIFLHNLWITYPALEIYLMDDDVQPSVNSNTTQTLSAWRPFLSWPTCLLQQAWCLVIDPVRLALRH